jgi:hypothetical protein
VPIDLEYGIDTFRWSEVPGLDLAWAKAGTQETYPGIEKRVGRTVVSGGPFLLDEGPRRHLLGALG